jgi:predicted ester cyclase
VTVDYKALVRRLYEEVENEQKLDLVPEIIHPEFRDVHNSGSPVPVVGVEGVKALAARLHATRELRVEIMDLIQEGDMVAAHLKFHTLQKTEFMGKPPTGQRFESQGVEIFRGKEGKLAERWVYIDQLSMMRTLGIIPPLGPAGK